MKKKRAFTLIELLVVIAIIALLLSILMPALKKVKKIAQIVVCTTNCKTLSIAWALYATDNHDKIVSSNTGFGSYFDNLKDPPHLYPSSWVDWAGYPTYTEANHKDQIKAVERGMLFPYVQTIKAYRCPVSKKDQARCYTIPDVYGNERVKSAPERGGDHYVGKTTDMKLPSDRIIFLDEDDITYGGFSIYFDRAQWWDKPPARHNDGVTLGYADGHAAYYKWKEEDTIDLAQEVITDPKQPGNEDLVRMQRGVFGTLGYEPIP